jgi:hypothetical protein
MDNLSYTVDRLFGMIAKAVIIYLALTSGLEINFLKIF